MARPSSSKGRVAGDANDRMATGASSASTTAGDSNKKPSSKPFSRKRMRAETAEPTTPDLFSGEHSGASSITGRNHPRRGNADDWDEFPAASDEPAERLSARQVPKSWVKFILGLFLAPVAWVLTQTFLQTFAASFHRGLLANPSAGYFTAGVILFVVLYLVIPQKALMIPYVLGHEVTHALWVKLFGGNVDDQFHVSLEGGHVLTDRVNTWIALAPYFFPIYSVLVVTLYAAASLAADMSPFRPFLFLLLGATIAFHLVFTCLLIAKGQPDLHYSGTFFSLMVIYLINLIIITCLLLIFDIALAEDAARRHKLHEISWLVTLEAFGGRLEKNSIGCIAFCFGIINWIIAWLEDVIAGFRH